MVILVAITYLALAACIESRPTSVPSVTPVYEWIGPGTAPSLEQLALSKSLCFQEAELLDPHAEPGTMSEHRKAHVKLCMRKEGWGEKAVK
jgi:hypothetical protein